MHSLTSRIATDRKRSSHGIGKSGDELLLSGLTNERAKDSFTRGKAKSENAMPEKFAFHKQSTEQKNDSEASDEMRTIERPLFAQRSSRIKSAGRFELDTGWVELGYDEKKSNSESREREGTSLSDKEKDNKKDDKQESPDNGSLNREKAEGNIYISFQSNYDDDDARKVKDAKAKKLPLTSDTAVKSNDESFQTGAEFFKAKKTLPMKKINDTMDKLSMSKGYKGTYDDVVPFHQSVEQSVKIDNLRKQMNNDKKNNKADIQKSITAEQTYKNKKDEIKHNFNNRLNREIENIKLENKASGEDIDFWLILKKKRLNEDKSERIKGNVDLSDKDENDNEESSNSKSKSTKGSSNAYESFVKD